MSNEQIHIAIEALLFAADEPVAASQIRRVIEDVRGQQLTDVEIEEAIARLNLAYQDGGRAFRIHAWAGGYRLATIDEMAPYIRALLVQDEERKLSRSLLETLAIVAYRQPTSKPEVDFVRGVNSDYALRQLMERSFITVVGRSEGVGRPLLYGTTEAFLDQFGLGTLDELPRPREIDELLADPAFSNERSVLLSKMEEAQSPTPEGDSAPFTTDSSDAQA